MKKLLILTLTMLPFTLSFTKEIKLKEVNRIKVPKGITATKDTLENSISITTPIYHHFAIVPYTPLSIEIYKKDTLFPVVQVYYSAPSVHFFQETTLYIENNQEVVNYSFKASNKDNKLIEFNMSVYSIESDSSTDLKLVQFLSENVSIKSKITIRFFDRNRNYVDFKLSKKDTK
ncbi:MAG: hypothetical protein ACRCV0_03200, partial [Brevinema sp.]